MNMNKADNSTVIPWKSLSEGQKIKASSDVKSDIWWVRLQNGKYGLTINFNGIVHIDLAQIRFSGADANLADVNGKSVFALSLREDADIEIFNRFGEDLVSVPVYDDKQKYADTLFVRMKQWMKFLQRLKKKEIDIRTQIGLIAELKFLQYMHSEYSRTYEELLAAWQGPERADKDFMFDDFFAEIKACFDDENGVHISNERQLARESKNLFLVCYKFAQDTSSDNLADIISVLIQQIRAEKENLVTVFEQKLLSVGYNPALLYENLVSVKDVSVTYYNVTDEFPSITVTDISECISNVKYDIDFMGMSKYAVQELIERKK